MAFKLRPHHDLAAVQAKFARVETLEISRTATNNARALGLSLGDIVEVVQAMQAGDFVKSETAHNPLNSKVWHDTYKTHWNTQFLYVKFAGETLVDVTITSFKEVGND